jgi:hypothetical protein
VCCRGLRREFGALLVRTGWKHRTSRLSDLTRRGPRPEPCSWPRGLVASLALRRPQRSGAQPACSRGQNSDGTLFKSSTLLSSNSASCSAGAIRSRSPVVDTFSGMPLNVPFNEVDTEVDTGVERPWLCSLTSGRGDTAGSSVRRSPTVTSAMAYPAGSTSRIAPAALSRASDFSVGSDRPLLDPIALPTVGGKRRRARAETGRLQRVASLTLSIAAAAPPPTLAPTPERGACG